MHKRYRNLLTALPLLITCVSAQAGVIIGGTRVVYGEKQSSIALSVRNNSPFAWLINSKVSTGGTWPGSHPSTDKAPFVITPPLFSLKADREGTLRIVYTGSGASLPRDRESLFTLSIATIPAGKRQDDSVELAVRTHLKLFYRPAGLQGSAQDAWQQLRWSKRSQQLVVENPTPYYVTMFNLQFNGQPVRNAGLVAPFGQRQFNGCQQLPQCVIHWQGINDYGRVMPAKQINVGR